WPWPRQSPRARNAATAAPLAATAIFLARALLQSLSGPRLPLSARLFLSPLERRRFPAVSLSQFDLFLERLARAGRRRTAAGPALGALRARPAAGQCPHPPRRGCDPRRFLLKAKSPAIAGPFVLPPSAGGNGRSRREMRRSRSTIQRPLSALPVSSAAPACAPPASRPGGGAG